MAEGKKNGSNKNRLLTINLNNEFIKVCELSKSAKNGIVVHKVFTIPTPPRSYRDGVIRDRNAIAKELKVALGNHGVQTTNVVYSISSSKIATKEVIIPYVPKNKIKTIVNMNASEYFPVNIDEYLIESSILETIVNPDDKKDRKLKLLVAAVPSKMVEEYYDFSSTMGFTIKAIDYAGNSTLQVLKSQSEVGSSVMIQIENDATIISVFEGSVLQLQRTVPYGKTAVVNAVMELRKIYSYDVALDLLQKETLVHDNFDGDEITDSLKFLVSNVNRVMDYQTSRNSNRVIERAYLVGNATYIKGLEELFKNNLNAPVESIQTLKGVTADKKTYVEENSLTTYITNIGSVIEPINFIPKRVTDTTSKSVDTSLQRTILIAACVVAAILIIVPYFSMSAAKTNVENLQDRIETLKPIEDIERDYNAAISNYHDVESFKLMTTSNDDVLLDLIGNIESYMPKDVEVVGFSVSEGYVNFTCKGTAKESMAMTIIQLESIPNVSNVKSYGLTEAVDDAGYSTVTFAISMEFTNLNMVTDTVAEGGAQ
jgi:type IV pilus assembly protein PilM